MLGIIYILIGSILFSAKAILVKLAYREGLDGIEALALRICFAVPFYMGSLIWIYSRYRKKTEKTATNPRILGMVVVYGFLGYYLASYLDFAGLQYITAGLERLVLFVYPTIVVLLNWIFFKKSVSPKVMLAVAITYLGIGLAYFHDVKIGGDNVSWGAFLVFLSAITYALYLMGSGDLIPKIGVNLFTSLAMLTSSVLVLIHFSITSEWTRFLEYNSYVYFLGFLLGIFTTVVPSYFISAGIHAVGSSRASIVSSVGPMSTILLAFIFLGETVGLYQILGTLFVVSGVLLIAMSKKSAENRAEREVEEEEIKIEVGSIKELKE
ncbi:MAG: EamA family transporter [Leptospira sp.]|nr:EamA family transporter [Leptospira sp.]